MRLKSQLHVMKYKSVLYEYATNLNYLPPNNLKTPKMFVNGDNTSFKPWEKTANPVFLTTIMSLFRSAGLLVSLRF